MAALAPKLIDAGIEQDWAWEKYLMAVKTAKDTHDAYKAEQREYAPYIVRNTVHDITRSIIPSMDKPQDTYRITFRLIFRIQYATLYLKVTTFSK